MALPVSTTVACIGECMIELRHLDDDTLALGFGGDTLNTAVYLARCMGGGRGSEGEGERQRAGGRGSGSASVHYVTALGDDVYSDEMVRRWRAEGIATDHVVRLPGRLPGLYIIRTDDRGERSFTYYRSASAAHELFRGDAGRALVDRLAAFDWLYLSGITLSILGGGARQQLWAGLDRARARGVRVAFDTNYRPAGWPDGKSAHAAVQSTLERVDLALPSLDDQRQLFGDRDAQACARRLHALGVAEVVVKQGSDGCVVSARGSSRVVPTVPVRAMDTTAAGDAFNAAYLAARMRGTPPVAAAHSGHRLAGVVVGHPGAIIPDEAMPSVDTGDPGMTPPGPGLE
jgi:2-dehydro-3-deoxygluconokinase